MKTLTVALAIVVAACGTPEAPPSKATSAVVPFKLSPAGEPFHGPIEEVLVAGGYTYLRVGDAWVVSLKKELAVGDVVRVRPFGVAEQFESKKLGRSFDVLHFSIVSKEQ